MESPVGAGGEKWLSFEMRQQSEYLIQSMAGSDLASSRSAEQAVYAGGATTQVVRPS